MDDMNNDVLPYEPKPYENPTKSNVLTEEQKAYIEEKFKKLKEPELYEKLAEFGQQVHRGTFGRYLRELSSKTEEEVLSQKLSVDELVSVNAGFCGMNGDSCYSEAEYKVNHCIENYARYIYEGGFPNCAATVGDGSWCTSNDACYWDAVMYIGMESCSKAWE